MSERPVDGGGFSALDFERRCHVTSRKDALPHRAARQTIDNVPGPDRINKTSLGIIQRWPNYRYACQPHGFPQWTKDQGTVATEAKVADPFLIWASVRMSIEGPGKNETNYLHLFAPNTPVVLSSGMNHSVASQGRLFALMDLNDPTHIYDASVV